MYDEIPHWSIWLELQCEVYVYVYVYAYVHAQVELGKRKEKFKFLCMLLIMYGITQVYRMYVRLATGPGGLKPIWILAPVAVRFSGRYRMVLEP